MADPLWGSVASGFHFNGANGSTKLTDVKGISWTRSGSPVISTAWSQFGGASASFNWSTGDFLYTDYNPVFDLSTTDFCIDGWLNVTSSSNGNQSYYGAVISKINSAESDVDWAVRCNNTDLSFEWGDDESPKKEIKVPRPANGTGFHFEVDRVGDSLYMFINGGLPVTGTIVGSIRNRAVQTRIGTSSGALYVRYHGYMDDLRLTRADRHTATFSVPTSEFAETALDEGLVDAAFSGSYSVGGSLIGSVGVAAVMSGDYTIGGLMFVEHTVPGGANVQCSGAYSLGGVMYSTYTPASISMVASGQYSLTGYAQAIVGYQTGIAVNAMSGTYSMRGALVASVWRPVKSMLGIVGGSKYSMQGVVRIDIGESIRMSGKYMPKPSPRIQYPYIDSDCLISTRDRITGVIQ